MSKLDEKTTIPLFAALIAAPTLIGGILWLSSINVKAEKALDQNTTLKEEAIEIKSDIKDLKKSLQRIEIKLGTQPRNKGE